MRRPLAAALGATALALGLAACGTAAATPDPQAAVQRCLYASVQAYPAWTSHRSLVNHLPECKDLTPTQRQTVKALELSFVRAVAARLASH